MKMFVVMTGINDPSTDDFDFWTTGVFRSLDKAKEGAIASVRIPNENNKWLPGFRITDSLFVRREGTENMYDLRVKFTWESKGKVLEGQDDFTIQEVEIGKLYEDYGGEIIGQ